MGFGFPSSSLDSFLEWSLDFLAASFIKFTCARELRHRKYDELDGVATGSKLEGYVELKNESGRLLQASLNNERSIDADAGVNFVALALAFCRFTGA